MLRETATTPGNEEFLDFSISLPLSAYTDASVKSVNALHSRVKSCAVIPSGTVLGLIKHDSYVWSLHIWFLYRMD